MLDGRVEGMIEEGRKDGMIQDGGMV